MQQQLATKLTLKSGGVEQEVSQPVSMAGANCAQADVTMITLTGTSPVIGCQLQESNDLQNWTDKGSPDTLSAVGTTVLTQCGGIGCAFLRMKYYISSGSSVDACIACNITTSSQ